MKGWVGLVGWPVADGLPTLVVTHQLQVERRTAKVRQSETDVLPLCYAAVYLLLFSVSYYLHNASGARYRRSACIDVDMLRLAAAACCDMGWISAQRGVGLLCDWSVLKRVEACINAEGGHSEHLCDIACLTFQSPHIQPVIFRATDDNPQLALFSQVKKFCNSQVSVLTFSGGVGKWITVCFLLI